MRRLILLVMVAGLVMGSAFAQTSLHWEPVLGGARDIGVGPNGEVWIIGTDKVPGGYTIHRRDGDKFTKVPGGATRIAVGPKGPFIVNSEGAIFRGDTKGNWEKMPGAAVDIGAGANGALWVIGTNPEAGGFGIYKWDALGKLWAKVPGSAERIAVDPKGSAWVVNRAKDIFKYVELGHAKEFTHMPGAKALDVGVGADGSVFVVGTDHRPYQRDGGQWMPREGSLDAISVDPKGRPWGVKGTTILYSEVRASLVGPGDIRAKLENLGVANNGRFGGRVFARNPWDMKAFSGKVYIGSGNSNNNGPDSNAGPVDVTYFDPATGKFGSDWQVNDEQIDLFRITDGMLTVPGHDPRENWSKGNFYRRQGEGKWQQVRTVDMAIHMYDIIQQGTYLYAAISTPLGGEVAVSSDKGRSWRTYMAVPEPGARARTFFVTPAGLCVSAHTSHDPPGPNALYTLTGRPFSKQSFGVTPQGLAPARGMDLFPGMGGGHFFAAKAVQFNGWAYYFGAYAPLDHNWKSENFYMAKDCKTGTPIKLPGRYYHHALVEGNKLYVSTSEDELGGRRNRLHVSTNGVVFKEVGNFWNKGFVRSFAILNGDFYFGIGSEAEAQVAETGTILRLKAADVPKI